MNSATNVEMDPNTAFYIVSCGRPRSPRAVRRVGPAFGTLEQAARALGFLRRKLPDRTMLQIEQDVRPDTDDG